MNKILLTLLVLWMILTLGFMYQTNKTFKNHSEQIEVMKQTDYLIFELIK